MCFPCSTQADPSCTDVRSSENATSFHSYRQYLSVNHVLLFDGHAATAHDRRVHMRVWNPDQASQKIRELQQSPGALLPILHALSAEFGYIDKDAIPLIADALNLSQAEVY